MNPISVVIPTYKNPEYLDLCLRSATEHQMQENQFVVVVDGHTDMYDDLMQKYEQVDWLLLPENKGQTYAHNTGVTLAENERILIVNDDNVFPIGWDDRLNSVYAPRRVIAPNQIEPAPSIFRDFIYKDFGKTPAEFDIVAYTSYDQYHVSTSTWDITPTGQTWPVFMNKKYYMAIGGIDPSFPSPAVADWDFFMRLEMIGLEMVRYLRIGFYHFAGAATKGHGRAAAHNDGEMKSHEYFAWKWGFRGGLNPTTHSKIPYSPKTIRGVTFNE